VTLHGSPIVTAPGRLPVLGHLVPLLRDPLRFLRSLPAHGDLVQVNIGFLKAIVVCDPELTRQVLREDREYDKGGPIFDRAREVLGDGLATCPHHKHRRLRRLAQPAFRTTRFSRYTQIMTERTAAATRSWHEGQIIDVFTEMTSITSGILAETMLSNALPPAAIRLALEDLTTVLDGWYKRMLTPPPLDRLPSPGNRRYERARVRLRAVIDGVIADRRADGTDHDDLLSALLNAQDEDGVVDGDQPLSDAELTDQILTFFSAGAESAATVVSWALYLMACHPDIEQRLHAELAAVLTGDVATYADVPRLELTGRIITETLRLYPPFWLLTRKVTVDSKLGDHIVPADATIVVSPYILHHRSDLHEDPEDFNPDRWADSQQKGQRISRDAFLPFSAGARKCIGDQFGLAESVLMLATITNRWRLAACDSRTVYPTKAATTLRPHGLRLRIAARAQAPISLNASSNV
jgi:cytochrome P450